jgi:hypothetical protein
MECGMRGDGGTKIRRAMLTVICIRVQIVATERLALQLRIRNLPGSNTSPKIQFIRGFPEYPETGHFSGDQSCLC